MDSSKDKAARALARAAWPIRMYNLGEEPSDDLSSVTTAQERLAMMWPLALEAWSLTGKPLPSYTREQMPVRCLSLNLLGERDDIA